MQLNPETLAVWLTDVWNEMGGRADLAAPAAWLEVATRLQRKLIEHVLQPPPPHSACVAVPRLVLVRMARELDELAAAADHPVELAGLAVEILFLAGNPALPDVDPADVDLYHPEPADPGTPAAPVDASSEQIGGTAVADVPAATPATDLPLSVRAWEAKERISPEEFQRRAAESRKAEHRRRHSSAVAADGPALQSALPDDLPASPLFERSAEERRPDQAEPDQSAGDGGKEIDQPPHPAD